MNNYTLRRFAAFYTPTGGLGIIYHMPSKKEVHRKQFKHKGLTHAKPIRDAQWSPDGKWGGGGQNISRQIINEN